MFHQKYLTLSCLKSIAKIRSEIKNRKTDNEDDINFKDNDREKNFIHLSNDNNAYMMFDEIEKIKKNSPFQLYCENLIKKYESVINNFNISKNISYQQNEFYCPELFKITSDKFYILPLWSDILLTKWYNDYPLYKSHTSHK